jgi:AcrR family transcriptional regulator
MAEAHHRTLRGSQLAAKTRSRQDSDVGRGPKRAAAYHHGDLARALLEATLELVEQRGPEGFTLRAAAKLAGVSDAAPYHHFADKDALLATLAEEGFDKLHERLAQAGTAEGLSSAERARAMGVAYVVFAAQNPAYFRVMFRQSYKQHLKHPGLARSAGRAFELVRGALFGALGSEKAARVPATQLIYGSWALVHGLAFLAIEGHLAPVARDTGEIERLVHGVLELFSERDRQR